VLGWAALLLGATEPLRVLERYRHLWGFNPSWRVLAYLLGGLELALGVLSAWAGWGLLKRRDWAPPVAALAAGAILVHVTFTLITEAEMMTGMFLLGWDQHVPGLLAWGIGKGVLNVLQFALWICILVGILGSSWSGVFPLQDGERGRLKRTLSAVLGAGVYAFLLFLSRMVAGASLSVD
jgi:hypothetical protein